MAADEDFARGRLRSRATARTTRATPSTMTGDQRAGQLRAALLVPGPFWTRCVVTPQSMISAGPIITSGTAPTAGGGVQSPSRSSNSRAPGDDRRPVRRAARLPSGGPRKHELVERRVHLEARKLEDPVAVLEEVVCHEQVTELADLVPPARQEPVVADELVLLDIREDRAREREQLLEPFPRVVVEQRRVLDREVVPLLRRCGPSGARSPLPLRVRRRSRSARRTGSFGSSNQLP